MGVENIEKVMGRVNLSKPFSTHASNSQTQTTQRSTANLPEWINLVFVRFTLIYPGRWLQTADNIEGKDRKQAFILGVKWEWADHRDLKNLDLKTAGAAVELWKQKPYPPNCPSDFAEMVKMVRAEEVRAQEREQLGKQLPPPPSEIEKRILAGAQIAARVKAENPDVPWGELQRLINQRIKEETPCDTTK